MPSSPTDTFARDRLPPPQRMPTLLFGLPDLQRLPERLNCAGALLDRWVAQGQGDRPCVFGTAPDGTPIRWTFDEIEHASFRWRGERLEPDGRTWRLQVEFRARRVT